MRLFAIPLLLAALFSAGCVKEITKVSPGEKVIARNLNFGGEVVENFDETLTNDAGEEFPQGSHCSFSRTGQLTALGVQNTYDWRARDFKLSILARYTSKSRTGAGMCPTGTLVYLSPSEWESLRKLDSKLEQVRAETRQLLSSEQK